MEPLSAVGGSENWFNPFGKLMWRFYKNTKIQLSYDLTDPLLDIHTKEMRTRHWIDIYTPMYTAALFTIAKIWKHPRCTSMDEWIKKDAVWIHNGILFCHEKRRYPVICDSMVGPWTHDAKCGKSDRERPELCDITYLWNLKKSDLRKKQTVVTR